MKIFASMTSAALGLAACAATSQAQLTLNFSSSPGSAIQFNGSQNSFQFNPSTFTGFGGIYSGTQWFVGNENGGTGSALGLFGAVTSGPFNYGPITISGNEQSAFVSGPLGQLNINDGAGHFLTGTVDWVKVQTFDYSGALNASLVVNVTGMSYGGSNPDLASLVATSMGAMNLSFQFSPGETLTQLSSGTSPFTTSYSGSIAVVPEPATWGLLILGTGITLAAGLHRRPTAGADRPVQKCQIQ